MTIYILPHRSSESAHYLRAAYPTLPGTEAAEETGMGLHARTQTWLYDLAKFISLSLIVLI